MSNKKLIVMGVDQAIPYLLDKLCSEEKLPNIKMLIEEGVKGEAYSCPPCDTPTNWTTIATGTNTAIHGVTSFYVHVPGEPFELGLQQRSRSQLSRFCDAEYLWNVADNNGYKPYVVNYPSGWPNDFKNGVMTSLIWPVPESIPRILTPQTMYSFSKNSNTKESKIIEKDDQLLIQLDIQLAEKHEKSSIKLTLSKNDVGVFDRIIISHKEKELENIEINHQDWSNWISIDLNTDYGVLPCLLKLKISELAQDGSALKIISSPIYNTKGWNNPDHLGEKIIKQVMSMDLNPKAESIEYKISGEVASYLDYAKKEASVLGKTIRLAQNEINWDMCYFHIHLLDSVNHKELAYLHQDSAIYSESKRDQAALNVENAYKIVDGLVGYLMEHCVDDDTVFAFVSDHGAMPAWKIANVPLTLMKAGLLTYKWKGAKKKYLVDWKKTRAFPYLEPPFIWVNLEGRDPKGCVKKSEYNDVREDIIEALYGMRDAETGDKVVKLALKREEAAFLGLNGNKIGDVVYFLHPPYQIYDEVLEQLNPSEVSPKYMTKAETYDAKHCFGAHAYYLPTEKLGNYSNSVPIILKGPGIESGQKIKRAFNLTDLAPTFASLLGLPRPKDSVGRILHEIIQ